MTIDIMEAFDLIGVVAFATLGAREGVERRFDVFGVLILSLLTAVGGGIVRDVVMANTPPLAFRDPFYVEVSLVSAALSTVMRRHLARFSHTLIVCDAIGLKNCQPVHRRGEEEKGKYDFVVSRAVMPLPDLVKIVRKNISKDQHNALPNGIICLKGGDVQGETQRFRRLVEITPLNTWFQEEWFKEKHCIYLPI